jgi:hypothetical protein
MKRHLVMGALLALGLAAAADETKFPAAVRLVMAKRGLENGSKSTPDGKLGLRVMGLTAQVLDTTTGKAVGSLLRVTNRRPGARITAHTFSPDGRLLAVGTGDPPGKRKGDSVGTVTIFEVATGKVVRQSNPPRTEVGYVNAIAFGPDGKTLLIDCDDISGK